MNDNAVTEQAALKRMSKTWREQGFEVYIEPTGSLVPSFLERYEPDAILLRGDEKVIVEVVRKGQPHLEKKISQIRSLFSGESGWRFEVVYAGEQIDAVSSVSNSVILATLETANSLLMHDSRASLLLLWASLEAIVRNCFAAQAARPQSPGRVIELLAGSGMITPSQAVTLRHLMHVRNRFIHGELDLTIEPQTVKSMHAIVKGLVNRIDS